MWGHRSQEFNTCSGTRTGGQAVLQLLFVEGFTFLVVFFLLFRNACEDSRKEIKNATGFLPGIITFREARFNPVSQLLNPNPAPWQSKCRARRPAVRMLYFGQECDGSCAESLTSRQNSLSDLPAGPMHNSLQLFPDEVLRVEGMMGREQAVGSAPPLLLRFLLVTLSKGPETHPSPFLSCFFSINVHPRISPPPSKPPSIWLSEAQVAWRSMLRERQRKRERSEIKLELSEGPFVQGPTEENGMGAGRMVCLCALGKWVE